MVRNCARLLNLAAMLPRWFLQLQCEASRFLTVTFKGRINDE